MDSTDSRSSWTATLAAIERDGERLLCGGGARLPSAAAKTAGWGLSGLEFGINIPGTAGGAVRMNANAYGGQLGRGARVGRGRDRGRDRAARARPSSASPTGSSNLARGRSRRPRLLPRSRPATRRRSGRRWRRCASAAARPSPRGSRPSARPSRTPRTSAPRAARPGSCSRRPAAAACAHGGARFSEKHANFVENIDGATTADVLALMAEGRRRVHERFGVELEPEVQVLGEVELARRLGAVRRAAGWRSPRVAASSRLRRLLVRRSAITTVDAADVHVAGR